MSESKYPVLVRWSGEDRAFIAEVKDLPGCMADGATRAEAVEAVEVVIREWIETAREMGRVVPEPGG
jgi:predicted RNase H-like HicB family nuclease